MDIPLIKPKEIFLTSLDDEKKTFRISRVPAVEGREVFTQYVPTATPKIGDYKKNEALMYKLMSYTEAQTIDGSFIRLKNSVLITAHVPDWEMLTKLEWEMVKYNTNFFNPGKISDLLAQFNLSIPKQITKILTQSLDALSQKTKQHSKS